MAPGSAIMSTYITGNTGIGYSGTGYGFMSGTSMAAPVVSGCVALYRAAYPNATPVEVEKAIKGAKVNGIIDLGKLNNFLNYVILVEWSTFFVVNI